MQWTEIRDDFPLLEHTIDLNAAGHGVPGAHWIEAIEEWLDFVRTGRNGRGDPASHPFLSSVFYECIERSAELIGADPVEVTNMYRPMTAANLVVNDLLEWEAGDNIVFTDLQYPSLPFVFLRLEEQGVELRRVENVGGEIRMEDLAAAIDNRTKLVSINRTTCFCGFTYDVGVVCDLAHDHDAFVLDDAMQAVGAVTVDVHEDDVDFLITGSYKWQLGPEGAGIFYIREDLIEEFDPSFRNYLRGNRPEEIPFSHPEHDNIEHWDYPLVQNANRFDQGICVTPVLFGWNASLEYLLDIGPETIESRICGHAEYLINRLQDIGCEIVTPINPDKRHGLIVYTTGSPESDRETMEQLSNPPIAKKPINLSNTSLGGVSGLRVSPHFYNTKADIDELIDRQQRILAE